MNKSTTKQCKSEGCDGKRRSQGYCNACYKRLRRYGKLPVLPKLTLADRFWRRFNKGSPDQCWEWQGGMCKGYGLLNAGGGGPMLKATHVSWFLHHGEWPTELGLWALHKCDNPACVNPAHLFLGTAQDNTDDMRRKGRSPAGIRNGTAKLTDADVREIRHLYATTETTHGALGEMFGVSSSNIGLIIQRKTWGHVV